MVPFGIVAGISATNLGLSKIMAIAMSIIIFAGTSPLATLELFGQHAPIVIIVLTGLIYSASLAPHFKGLSVLWKGPLAYLLADQAYAVSIVSYNKGLNKGVQHWYFLGAALTVRVVWLCGTAAGAFLGAQIPASWSLDFTIPLSFLSLLLPSIKDKPSVIAAISAGTIALIARDLPFNIGIFLLPWPVY